VFVVDTSLSMAGEALDQAKFLVQRSLEHLTEQDRLGVGQFDEVGWTWRDAGQLYEFPRSDSGTIRYGNIEGVSWISPTRIVTVSDRRKKKNQPDKGLSEKDQSIHIFDIPS